MTTGTLTWKTVGDGEEGQQRWGVQVLLVRCWILPDEAVTVARVRDSEVQGKVKVMETKGYEGERGV